MRPVMDRALWAILASNLLTLVMAVWQGWSLLQVLWPFWIQSVIIGAYAARRMFVLERFCVEGLRVNGRPVDATPGTARGMALFFMVHYGFFHLVYFVLLAGMGLMGSGGVLPVLDEGSGDVMQVQVGQVEAVDWLILLALGIAFWQSHRLSHREHVLADLRGTPRLGLLMMMPYLRIIPMHATIILGAWLGSGTALWLFLALKTAADAGMHVAEHRLLQGRAAA